MNSYRPMLRTLTPNPSSKWERGIRPDGQGYCVTPCGPQLFLIGDEESQKSQARPGSPSQGHNSPAHEFRELR